MPRFICIYVYIEQKKQQQKLHNSNRMMFVCFQKLSNLMPPDGIHRGVKIVDLGLEAEHTLNLKICMHLG